MRTHLVRLTAEGEAALARWRDKQEQEVRLPFIWDGDPTTEAAYCPRCNERLNPDEPGFCEGCFQSYPMKTYWHDANMGGALMDSYRGWSVARS